jgi:hypothetical protein
VLNAGKRIKQIWKRKDLIKHEAEDEKIKAKINKEIKFQEDNYYEKISGSSFNRSTGSRNIKHRRLCKG